MEYNLIKAIEFDKNAILSYNAIHGTNIEKMDIRQVSELPVCDFLTYGFPCTDISVGGKQEGIKIGTRSGLLFEVERLLEDVLYKPKFLIMENVKNLLYGKHKPDFDRWLEKLEELGYVNYYQVLNAKHYGIPQNRERVFCISVRKDIDNGFEFPEKRTLHKTPKDFLEKDVDERYYTDKIPTFNFTNFVTWMDGKGNKNGSYNRAWKSDKIVGTINCCNKIKIFDNDTVRVLTALESFRFMGFSDDDYNKMALVNKESYLYKQAGNTIVVDVLIAIFEKLQEYYPKDFIAGIDVVTLFSGVGAFEKGLKKIKNKGELK